MSRNLNAAHAEALAYARTFRMMKWDCPFQLNPRWMARRELRKARLIRRLMQRA